MNKLTIGSDPEFAFYQPVKDGEPRFIRAENLIMEKIKSPRQAPFGLDSAPTTGEIRPKHSTDPLKHAENIKKLLEKASKDYPELFIYSLKATSLNAPIGGHIHLGHPQIFNWETPLIDSLDVMLGFPSMFLEDQAVAKKRKCTSYGRLGSIREQNWGLEYRTPASWLASEKLTKSILCLAFSIAHHVINDNFELQEKDNFKEGSEIFNQAFNLHDIKLLRPHLFNSLRLIKTLPLYPKYKKHLDFFIKYTKEGKPLFETEIKKGWRIKAIRRVLKLLEIDNYYYKALKIIFKLDNEKIIKKEIKKNPKIEFKKFFKFIDGEYTMPLLTRSVSAGLQLANPKVFKNSNAPKLNRVYGINKARTDQLVIKSGSYDNYNLRPRLRALSPLIKQLAKNEGIDQLRIVTASAYGENSIGFHYDLRKNYFRLCQSILLLFALAGSPDLWNSSYKNGNGRPIIKKKIEKAFLENRKKTKLLRLRASKYSLEAQTPATFEKIINENFDQLLKIINLKDTASFIRFIFDYNPSDETLKRKTLLFKKFLKLPKVRLCFKSFDNLFLSSITNLLPKKDVKCKVLNYLPAPSYDSFLQHFDKKDNQKLSKIGSYSRFQLLYYFSTKISLKLRKEERNRQALGFDGYSVSDPMFINGAGE